MIDLQQISKIILFNDIESSPELKTNDEYLRIIDLVQKNKIKSSLKDLVEQILLKKLCKHETLSNWRNTPLRKAQIHYAVLDVYSLHLILEKLMVFSSIRLNIK